MRFSLRDRGWRRLLLLVVSLVHCPLAAVARADTRHVLVLSSSERPFAPQSGFADALMRDLIRSSREPIQFVEVSVQAARASGEAPDVSIAERIRSALGTGRMDLVLTIGGPAATIAQQLREELFPATPMLLAGVDRRFVAQRTLAENQTAVATEHDPGMMIDEMLRLLPDTRTVMVVVGASQVEQFWLKEMKREFGRFGDRLQFTYTNELSFAEIVARSRAMPAHSAIFFAILALDGKGEPRIETDTLSALHDAANVPMFALYGMGRGIVGGPLLSVEELSRTTTRVALRVLAGESPGRINTPAQRSGQPTYDARELRRWKIEERRLPVNSVVLFREPTIWQRYQRPITFATLLVIPAIALLGVMKRRRERRRGPVAKEAVVPEPGIGRAHAELTNLSRHLMQAQERERAALATTLHEDVCQRMAALTMRLHNLEGAAHDGEVAEINEELRTLVGEIAAASDPAQQRLELLGLPAAVRGFCEDLAERYDMTIYFQDEAVPADLPPDIALALFRVLQEATVNAVLHSGAREVWVSVRGTAAEIRLEVADRGIGFDAQAAVPGGGVGLVAIRERLKLVDGESRIGSRPGDGTRVEAWVPLRRRSGD